MAMFNCVMEHTDSLTLKKTVEIVDFTIPEIIVLLSKCLSGLVAIHEQRGPSPKSRLGSNLRR